MGRTWLVVWVWSLAWAGGVARGQDAPPAWSWQQPHAEVLPTGDLRWRPEPFRFSPGRSVRYIDFAAGDDARDGLSRDTAWRHHPWDPAATATAAACAGTHTYVFKRGVVYRGMLVTRESGTPDEALQLTSDPAWGDGEAVLSGAEAVTGWQRGTPHPDMPSPEAVWQANLEFAPRNVWQVAPDGTVVRIALARTPNWTVSDPDDIKGEWWEWDLPGKPFDVFTTGPRGNKLHLGIDTVHLIGPAAQYQDAIVWTEYGWVMGTPYPTRVETVDTAQHGLGFGGQWGGVGDQKIVRFNRYYLEDKPHYLDAPGEFWFEKKGEGGRLYLRLPKDQDPNTAHVEVARRLLVIDSRQVSHLRVSGLTFRFTNVLWDLTAGPWAGDDTEPACVRLLGAGQDIQVDHCRFEHVHRAVRLKAVNGGTIGGVRITDNEVRDADHAAFEVADDGDWGVVLPTARLLDVRILRNKLERIGSRPSRYGQGHAIEVRCAETLEVAGNILDRLYGAGIFVFGGKQNEALVDRPLSRLLVHHNKVTDSLLNTNDWGGIETWQGGPAYVFDNISGNPGGYWNYSFKLNPGKPAVARFGHAYYLDGAFKNYYFNNIAWGRTGDPLSRLGNTAAFQEIHSYQNTFFNNSVDRFVIGSRRQAPQAGRDKFLGNVWQGIGLMVFRHSEPAKAAAEGNAADAGAQKSSFAYETNAYHANVFHEVAAYGVFEETGRVWTGFAEYATALAARHSLAADLGTAAPAPPLPQAGEHDFRPAPGSAAVDAGVRAFVPWALAAVVGEWHFTPGAADPTRIVDEHWYMTPYHVDRETYYQRPTYPLQAVNVTADSYTSGPLEDWTSGALRLNGRDQYARLANADADRPFEYKAKANETRTVRGPDLKSPQVHTSNFLVEIYFRAEPGRGGVLVQKQATNGYALRLAADGRPVFAVAGGGEQAEVTGKAALNDGTWHHLIAEADRAAKRLQLYVDGHTAAAAAGLGPQASLANDADLLVGGTPTGDCLAGTLDFARIALGTLADAKTTIAELYAWQFDGPQLRDFAGHAPTGPRRDAGALELQP